MVRRTITLCDRCEDDTFAVDSIVLSLDHQTLTGDLCQAHLDEYTEQLDDFRTSWCKVFRADDGEQRQPSSRRRSDRGENAAIRQWAKEQNINLGDRGRIPEDLRARYRSEQGREASTRWTAAASG